ncbi:MAG TPA: GNAT family N-acetyltransferase [Actinomycetota bacterium]|nr:GNAT family N-acetyltransferase [Actinomycetota bacterium]
MGTEGTLTDRDVLARVAAFADEHQNRSASRRESWSGGSAIFHDDLPLIYDLNLMRLEVEGLDVATVAAEADRLMGQLGHRQLTVRDEVVGRTLVDGLVERGWHADRHVVMVHRREPDRVVDTHDVEEVAEPVVWPSRAEWLRTYEWASDKATIDQLHAAYRIWMRAGNGRDFALKRDDKPVSFAMLWTEGEVAQIEDVATLDSHRNQGLCRAVVGRCVEEARSQGCDVIFLIADEADWPKELYRKIGFETVGCFYYFLKTNS